MEDAGEKTSNDLADVNHAIHDLPEGWVTREMIQKTHAAIDNCLKKLHTLMQEPCQETQASSEFDKGEDQDHDNEGLSGVTDAEKLGDDTDDKNNEDKNDGKFEIQVLNDQTYVDDIYQLRQRHAEARSHGEDSGWHTPMACCHPVEGEGQCGVVTFSRPVPSDWTQHEWYVGVLEVSTKQHA